MSKLRISDAPLLPDVDGTEKIPTGGRGDYAISVDQIKDHIFQDIGKELVGLGNVDNTSDLDKPVSTAQQVALNLKADKTYVDTNLDLKADKTNVYTRSETTLALSTKADLVGGVIPSNQLPSYVDDVVEYTTNTLPIVGESGKIYITTDTNRTWRWSGNQYVEISNGGISDSTLKLQTPRKIADVYFDGAQNIDIPHNNLKNRDVIGVHPASAISYGTGNVGDFLDNQYALNTHLNRTVKTIADLKALQPRFNNERVFVRERHDGFGCGGGFFEYVESSTKTDDGGLFFDSVSTGKWHRIFDDEFQLSWWYAGDWDDAIDNAVLSIGSNYIGGRLHLPLTDITINRTHQINAPILIIGSNCGAVVGQTDYTVPDKNGGAVLVADGVTAFRFGNRAADDGGIMRVFGAGLKGVTAYGINHTRGNISSMYGSSNETFGFETITTSLAGAKNASTNQNMTNILCDNRCAFAPFIFEDNYIIGFGHAFRNVAATYDIKPNNNLIRWCTVGMYMGANGVPTTCTFRDNTIERCAIGIHVNYPSSLVKISGGVIEANYGGCDVFLFNAAHTMDIEFVYFEASPNNIVIRGDSAASLAHNLTVYKCTGVHIYTRCNARNYKIKDCWLKGLDLNPFVAGYIRNILIEDCYQGAAKEKFVATAENIVLGSVAANYAHEIKIVDTINQIKNVALVPASMNLATPQSRLNKLVSTNTTANNVSTLTITVPNINTNAVLKIALLKYVGNTRAESPRYYEYLFAIRRVAGQATLYEFQELTKKSFTSMGTTEVLDNAAPTVTISGAATEDQTLVLNMVNGQTGGVSGHNLLSVDWLSSTAGLDIK